MPPKLGVNTGYSIRMVTLHIGRSVWWEKPRSVEDEAYALLEAVDRASEEGLPRPGTARITLPPAEAISLAADAASEVGEIAESAGVLVNVGYYPLARVEPGYVRDIVVDGLYLSLSLGEGDWDTARRAARIMNMIAEEDPNAVARLAVNTSDKPIITPFYPLSASPPGRRLASVGLTYPRFLLNAYLRGGSEEMLKSMREAASAAAKLASYIAGETEAEWYGVDLSVAPWMEDSALALVETIAGTRLPEAGIAFGIAVINALIAIASKNVESLGFNEVQLPVAEDSKLKARVSEGDTTARDLARLAGACLAGLDMVAVPFDERGVAGLILEVAAYSRAKERPLGVRLIPLEGVEPGDKISLDRFGEIPVIPL